MAAGENVEGTAGIIPVSLNLGDLGSSKSESNASGYSTLSIGEKYVTSGKSTAGNLGLVKSVALAIVLIAGYAVFMNFADKKGGK